METKWYSGFDEALIIINQLMQEANDNRTEKLCLTRIRSEVEGMYQRVAAGNFFISHKLMNKSLIKRLGGI